MEINNIFALSGEQVPQIAISSRLDEGKGEALVILSSIKDLKLIDVKNALRCKRWHCAKTIYPHRVGVNTFVLFRISLVQ